MMGSLVLRTSALPQTLPSNEGEFAANTVGAVNKYRTRVTFFNLDVSKIFGPIYEEYDYFNLRLTSFSTAFQTNGTPATTFRNGTINVSGLSWIASNYSTQYAGNISESAIAPFQIVTNSGISLIYDSLGCASTFSKPAGNFDLTITLRDITNDSYEGSGRISTDVITNYVLIFDIVGVKL